MARARLILGAVCLAILSTAFSALYWNRFLAPSCSGTFFYYAEQLLQGRLPYRDIFLVVTPLDVFKIAGLIRVFGDTLIVARIESVIERTILALLIYFLLTRFCRAGSAMLASFLSIIILASDQADAMINYHIDSVFWAVAATACAALGIQHARRNILSFFFAGFFASFCLLTKQTTGVGTAAALFVVGILLTWKTAAHLRFAIPFSLGFLLPMLAFAAWLKATGSLTPFLHTVFTTKSSKGSLFTVLLRPVLQFPWLFVVALAATLLLAWAFSRSCQGKETESLRTIPLLATYGAAVLVLVAISIQTGAWWPGSSPLPLPPPGATAYPPSPFPFTLVVLLQNLSVMIGLLGSALIFLRFGWKFLNVPLTQREQQIWLVSAISFASAYMLSLSWAVYSPMAAPGVGLVAGLAADRLEAATPKRFWAFAASVFLLIYGSAGSKLMQPFNWMYWPEPEVSQARYSSPLPKLAGLRVSQPTLSLTEDITKLVQQHSKAGDSLLVYPYFPIFYVLTGLNPPTYTFNHYLDVCPDSICHEDAQAIRAHPPDAIVYLIENDEDLSKDEAVFRSGRKSGSRDVVRAIEGLLPGYHKLLSARIPGSLRTIEVYSKR